MLLAMTGYADPRWLTFRQAKALGGSVRKGEEGSPIVFWKMLDKKQAEQEGGRPLELEASKGQKVPMLRYFTVFNVAQCEGLNLPELEEVRAFEPIEAAAALVEAMPQRPEIRHGFKGASYSPAGDEVRMPNPGSFESPEDYFATLFHELTHATGHKSRLARHEREEYAFHSWGDENYSREELVAEFGSAFLTGETGIEATTPASASYIASWLKTFQGNPKMAVIAAAQAQKAADFILNRNHQAEASENTEAAA